eukprot:364666-Chlamydomonas_euryale.AAC.1
MPGWERPSKLRHPRSRLPCSFTPSCLCEKACSWTAWLPKVLLHGSQTCFEDVRVMRSKRSRLHSHVSSLCLQNVGSESQRKTTDCLHKPASGSAPQNTVAQHSTVNVGSEASTPRFASVIPAPITQAALIPCCCQLAPQQHVLLWTCLCAIVGSTVAAERPWYTQPHCHIHTHRTEPGGGEGGRAACPWKFLAQAFIDRSLA